jgi:hypothetical protein
MYHRCSLSGYVLSSGMLRCAYCITLRIEAVRTPETYLSFYQATRHNSPRDSHLHIHRSEELKSDYTKCSNLFRWPSAAVKRLPNWLMSHTLQMYVIGLRHQHGCLHEIFSVPCCKTQCHSSKLAIWPWAILLSELPPWWKVNSWSKSCLVLYSLKITDHVEWSPALDKELSEINPVPTPCIGHLIVLDLIVPKTQRWRAHKQLKDVITQLSPFSFCFAFRRPKHSPQHFVPKNRQFVSLP